MAKLPGLRSLRSVPQKRTPTPSASRPLAARDRDYGPTNELGFLEDGAEEALGKQVLDEHHVHRVAAEVGVERFAAKLVEVLEGHLEAGVVLVGLFDFFLQARAESGDAVLEFLDGFLERFDFGLDVLVEVVDEARELGGVGKVGAEYLALVLVEDGLLSVLEDDVRGGVAALDFLFDFRLEVVGAVLCFPVAARQVIGVADSAVGDDGAAAGFGA